jgi:hypothetical protein
MVGDVFIAGVEDMTSVERDVRWIKLYPARTTEIPVDVETVIVRRVVTMHGPDLGKSAKYFRIVRKLSKNFAWFCGGWVECHFSKSPGWTVVRKVLSPLF